MFISFDVFDTCLIRRCGKPEKIFEMLADELLPTATDATKLAFFCTRKMAEKRAKDFFHQEYPSLDDIYMNIDLSPYGLNVEEVKRKELELEDRELFPNPHIKEIIEQERKKGNEIAFISDMYLPSAFISKILEKFNLKISSDLLFVSTECKADKFSGKLFKKIHDDRNVKYKDWIHYGDNLDSDYKRPRSLGIKANHISYTQFNKYELGWIENAKYSSQKKIIEHYAAITRLCRIQSPQKIEYTLAYSIVATTYVPFVYRVMKDAVSNGIENLFFAARDGQIFFEIAKGFSSQFPSLALHYLKISRKSIYPCSFVHGNVDEMRRTVECIPGQSVKNILSYMNVSYEKFSEKFKSKYKPTSKITASGMESFIADLVVDPAIQLCKKVSAEKRAVFIEYLRSFGNLEKKSMLVDLGWNGTLRRTFNYILKEENIRPFVVYYWGVGEKLRQEVGENFFVYCQNIFFDDFGRLFMEHYCSITAEGSTLGYHKENESIVTEEDVPTNKNKEAVLANRTCSLKIAKEILGTKILEKNDYNLFLKCGLKSLQFLIQEPDFKEIDFFKQLNEENMGVQKRFVEKLSLKNVFALLLWGVPTQSLWVNAAVKDTFKSFGNFFVLLYKFTSRSFICRFVVNIYSRIKM